MPNERESFIPLDVREYDIAGNLLRAFVNPDGDIVFVLDLLIDENKPNVLLIIDSYDNRKWDDVLENDYGVDLETVRPKKDNKYQKLDIEYSGLSIYQELIDKYVAGEDVSESVALLNSFRRIAVKRAAQERLDAAEVIINNAYETIEKTNDSIDDMTERLERLRAQLTEVRANIGKEPTKQSAAKILRAESQIDATGEKIRRAKKRLENAQKRLVSATDDADAAREILDRLGDLDDVTLPAIVHDTPLANIPERNVAIVKDAPLPTEYSDQSDFITTNNTKAEDMADEEVKPLFDTDPEILDEEIAFKPIDFSAPIVAPETRPVVPNEPSVPDVYNNASDVAPLSFAPPIATEQYNATDDVLLPSQKATGEMSVLDSITAVETPTGMDVTETESEFIPRPVSPLHATPAPEPKPESDVAVAPIESGVRPVSPLTGDAPVAVVGDAPKQKQSIVYYVMLIALIVMSVFVLWFYQKSTGGNGLPTIGGKFVSESDTTDVAESQPEPEQVVVEQVTVTEPEPVKEEPVVAKPEPTPEPMPEPVVIEAEPEPIEPTEVVVPVSVSVISGVTSVPEPETKKIETEEEILAKKPAYGVSQNEAMFVADDAFETDRLGNADIVDDDIVAVDMYDTPIVRVQQNVPQVQYQEPEFIEDDYVEDDYVEDDYVEDDFAACEGGASPDRFGCCPGETYTQIDNGGFVCCPDAGGDCFPPLI